MCHRGIRRTDGVSRLPAGSGCGGRHPERAQAAKSSRASADPERAERDEGSSVASRDLHLVVSRGDADKCQSTRGTTLGVELLAQARLSYPPTPSKSLMVRGETAPTRSDPAVSGLIRGNPGSCRCQA